jgi:hypothetical protein
MSPQRAEIVIGTPCYGGLMTHVYVHSLLKLREYAAAHDMGIGLWTAAHDSLITRSRNSILSGFLETKGSTHLLFIDADIGFEAEHVHRMLRFDEDLVAGMYPVKNIDWSKVHASVAGPVREEQLRESGLHFVGLPLSEGEREERDGFVTGRYAGAGFLLIRRSCAERMAEAYPETRYRFTQTYPPPTGAGAPLYNLFDCMVREDGTYLSEDYTFCERWRRLGGKVWLDTRGCLKHVGSYVYQGTPTIRTNPA